MAFSARKLATAFLATALLAQTPDFTCPMDPDVRSQTPGKCPRCGMKLEARIADFVAYPVRFGFAPPAIPAGRPLDISIAVNDPKTGKRVTQFETMHERLMHLFVVSSDLEYFSHEHPDRNFVLHTQLPKPGNYKLVADFYPTGGTAQLAEKIISTAGYDRSLEESLGHPAADLGPKRGENLEVELTMEKPMAGRKSLLFFHVRPDAGIEQYLGAWAHMLIVSDDLVDTTHEHPSIADGGPEMQFDVFFPRARTYRVWLQIQRLGKVNTVAFTIPVAAL
ncbi:MAG: hypothetical protein JWO80_6495 [Bryobacterales bacterium]|nr:hypothetical protein [Bryobacterales bacterium]